MKRQVYTEKQRPKIANEKWKRNLETHLKQQLCKQCGTGKTKYRYRDQRNKIKARMNSHKYNQLTFDKRSKSNINILPFFKKKKVFWSWKVGSANKVFVMQAKRTEFDAQHPWEKGGNRDRCLSSQPGTGRDKRISSILVASKSSHKL